MYTKVFWQRKNNFSKWNNRIAYVNTVAVFSCSFLTAFLFPSILFSFISSFGSVSCYCSTHPIQTLITYFLIVFRVPFCKYAHLSSASSFVNLKFVSSSNISDRRFSTSWKNGIEEIQRLINTRILTSYSRGFRANS